MRYAASKSLSDYYAQARLRGGQIITAVQAVYPAIEFMVLISPNSDCVATPSLVYSWNRNPDSVRGAFTVGLMMGSNKPIIDGNEVGYAYRSQAEFDAAYTWDKTGIAASGCPFIPPTFASTYPSRVSVSEPVYNRSITYANSDQRVMNLTVLPTVIYGPAWRGQVCVAVLGRRELVQPGRQYPTASRPTGITLSSKLGRQHVLRLRLGHQELRET